MHAKDKKVYFLCCDQKAWTEIAQSFKLWQQAIIEITRRDHSIIVCSRHIYLCVALCAHPICGESHFQRNINWEVATTSPPFCSELHLSHILLWRLHLAAPSHPGQSTTLLWLESPGGKYAKLHTGSKQQYRSHVVLILFLLVCETYIWVLFFTYIPFVANCALNTTLTEWLQSF